MQKKTVYQTNHLGLYVGPVQAEESPLEPGVFLLPAGCVEPKPPQAGDAKAAIWIEEAWQVVDFYGGLTAYHTETAAPLLLTGLGPLPNGYTLKKPGPNQVWKSGRWIDDINAVMTALYPRKLEALKAACAAHIAGGFSSRALGASHRYSSDLEDQVNLTGLVLHGEDSEYPCYTSDGTKVWIAHTAMELSLLAYDLIQFKHSALKHLESLRRELAKALDEKDLPAMQAVEWGLGK